MTIPLVVTPEQFKRLPRDMQIEIVAKETLKALDSFLTAKGFHCPCCWETGYHTTECPVRLLEELLNP